MSATFKDADEFGGFIGKNKTVAKSSSSSAAILKTELFNILKKPERAKIKSLKSHLTAVRKYTDDDLVLAVDIWVNFIPLFLIDLSPVVRGLSLDLSSSLFSSKVENKPENSQKLPKKPKNFQKTKKSALEQVVPYIFLLNSDENGLIRSQSQKLLHSFLCPKAEQSLLGSTTESSGDARETISALPNAAFSKFKARCAKMYKKLLKFGENGAFWPLSVSSAEENADFKERVAFAKSVSLFSLGSLIEIDVWKSPNSFDSQFYIDAIFENGDVGFWRSVCCSDNDYVNTTGIKFLIAISTNKSFSLYFSTAKTKRDLLKIAITALSHQNNSPDIALYSLDAISHLFELDLSAIDPKLKTALFEALNDLIKSESVSVVNAVLRRLSVILEKTTQQWPEAAFYNFEHLFDFVLKTPKNFLFKMNRELIENFVSAFTTSVVILNDFLKIYAVSAAKPSVISDIINDFFDVSFTLDLTESLITNLTDFAVILAQNEIKFDFYRYFEGKSDNLNVLTRREFSNIVEYLIALKKSGDKGIFNKNITVLNRINAKFVSKIVFLLINSPDLGLKSFFNKKCDKNRLNCEKMVGLGSKLVTTFSFDYSDMENVLCKDEINWDFFDILYESDFGVPILSQICSVLSVALSLKQKMDFFGKAVARCSDTEKIYTILKFLVKLEETWPECEKNHSDVCGAIERLLCSKVCGWVSENGGDERKMDAIEEIVLYLKPCFGLSLMAIFVPLLNLDDGKKCPRKVKIALNLLNSNFSDTKLPADLITQKIVSNVYKIQTCAEPKLKTPAELLWRNLNQTENGQLRNFILQKIADFQNALCSGRFDTEEFLEFNRFLCSLNNSSDCCSDNPFSRQYAFKEIFCDCNEEIDSVLRKNGLFCDENKTKTYSKNVITIMNCFSSHSANGSLLTSLCPVLLNDHFVSSFLLCLFHTAKSLFDTAIGTFEFIKSFQKINEIKAFAKNVLVSFCGSEKYHRVFFDRLFSKNANCRRLKNDLTKFAFYVVFNRDFDGNVVKSMFFGISDDFEEKTGNRMPIEALNCISEIIISNKSNNIFSGKDLIELEKRAIDCNKKIKDELSKNEAFDYDLICGWGSLYIETAKILKKSGFHSRKKAVLAIFEEFCAKSVFSVTSPSRSRVCLKLAAYLFGSLKGKEDFKRKFGKELGATVKKWIEGEVNYCLDYVRDRNIVSVWEICVVLKNSIRIGVEMDIFGQETFEKLISIRLSQKFTAQSAVTNFAASKAIEKAIAEWLRKIENFGENASFSFKRFGEDQIAKTAIKSLFEMVLVGGMPLSIRSSYEIMRGVCLRQTIAFQNASADSAESVDEAAILAEELKIRELKFNISVSSLKQSKEDFCEKLIGFLLKPKIKKKYYSERGRILQCFLSWNIFLDVIGTLNKEFKYVALRLIRKKEMNLVFDLCRTIFQNILCIKPDAKKAETDYPNKECQKCDLRFEEIKNEHFLAETHYPLEMNKKRLFRNDLGWFHCDDAEEETGFYCFEKFALRLYGRLLYRLPVAVRFWTESLNRYQSGVVKIFTEKFFSKHLIKNEIASINIVSDDMKIKCDADSRRVVAFLNAKDMKLVLNLTFPSCYPLQKIQFRFSDDLKLKRKESQWIAKLVHKLNSLQSSVSDAILIWKDNIRKYLDGFEECPICFTIIHESSKDVPRMPCGTCKAKFHNHCIFRWFANSRKKECPMCRSLFFGDHY